MDTSILFSKKIPSQSSQKIFASHIRNKMYPSIPTRRIFLHSFPPVTIWTYYLYINLYIYIFCNRLIICFPGHATPGRPLPPCRQVPTVNALTVHCLISTLLWRETWFRHKYLRPGGSSIELLLVATSSEQVPNERNIEMFFFILCGTLFSSCFIYVFVTFISICMECDWFEWRNPALESIESKWK